METKTPVEWTQETRRGVMRWALSGLVAKAVLALVLMLSAGRWDWAQGWAYVAVMLAFDLATTAVVLPRSRELLAERAQLKADTKRWDKLTVRLVALYLPMATWVLAGLDERFGWLPEVPAGVQALAGALVVLGYAIVVWAMAANAYFSTTARIQTERGHTVATGGPYALVRHPGYVGAIMFGLALPLMLGSLWAMLPAVAGAALYVVRTELEDRMLQQELKGYADYARSVRYRLLPGIW